MGRKTVVAPAKICLRSDDSVRQTLHFLRDIERVKWARHVFVDCSATKWVDPGTLAIIAVALQKVVSRGVGAELEAPTDASARRAFLRSGIQDYLAGVEVEEKHRRGKTLMLSGDDLEAGRERMKEGIEHVRRAALKRPPRKLRSPTYEATSELINNTAWHADGAKLPENPDLPPFGKRWYLHGAWSKLTTEGTYAFFDRGVGIPRSRGGRLYFHASPLRLHDLDIVDKAMKGEIKSRTELQERGEGLQFLRRLCLERQEITDLVVLSGKAWLNLSKGKRVRLPHYFEGTAFFWKVDYEPS